MAAGRFFPSASHVVLLLAVWCGSLLTVSEAARISLYADGGCQSLPPVTMTFRSSENPPTMCYYAYPVTGIASRAYLKVYCSKPVTTASQWAFGSYSDPACTITTLTHTSAGSLESVATQCLRLEDGTGVIIDCGGATSLIPTHVLTFVLLLLVSAALFFMSS